MLLWVILYSLGDEVDEENSGLLDAISKNIPFPVAVSFVLFAMIYLPCLAATVVFTKEAGGYKYLGYLILFTTIVAWLVSFIGYNIAQMII